MGISPQRFGPFRVDLANACVWRQGDALKLTPKAFAVLGVLLDRSGQLVTKEELFQAVWPETVVSEAALTVCIQELRKVLGDNSRAPQYIETVHRRGFRFLGQLQPVEEPSQTSPETVHHKNIERKLVAILSADVQGYSRLMSDDEEATIRTLTLYREVMTRLIQQHHGRVVDAPGDNLLAEFASAVDAVQGAVAIQQELAARNAALPAQRQMVYRMGINVGDVVVEGGQLYGDGVNIAARLESLAEGGGICISGTVYDQTENKVSLECEDLGERRVKNIAKPVRVYRVQWQGEALAARSLATSAPGGERRLQQPDRPRGAKRRQPLVPMVGREAELAQLHGDWEDVLRGERRIIFVTGEAGIGKTTLVDRLLEQSGAEPQGWIARGQCIEHYGASEPYMPVLEALGRLCREADGPRVLEVLGRYAPTWLVQMPALIDPGQLEILQRKVAGATKERMLREMAEALEALTAEQLLVVVLEDLHWSDYSTLELLSALARRREPAHLLVLGTYRPVEVMASEHPLRGMKQELQLHGQCEELALGFLSEEAVADYLAQRFAAPSPASEGEGWGEGLASTILHGLAQIIHQDTDGNPLFMVTIVDSLVRQGVITQIDGQWELHGKLAAIEVGIPESLRQLIERQIEQLSPEAQQMLETASVTGMEFSAAAVATGVAAETNEIEGGCEALVRRGQFLQAKGTAEWPDGTVAGRYGFIHALYQEVLYERVPVGRRVHLHQRTGERQEQGYGLRVREIAAELAVHFERGRDYPRAIQYLQQAGENAVQRSAHQEAIGLLTRGLALLQTAPETPERTPQEIGLQMALGISLSAVKGWGAPEVEHTYARACAPCQQIGETPQLFFVLAGLQNCYFTRGELAKAHDLAEQLLRLAQTMQLDVFIWAARIVLGVTLSFMGELRAARQHLEQQCALFDHQQSGALSGFADPEVGRLSRLATILGLLGYPDQARRCSEEALALAQELDHPFSLAFALFSVAEIHCQYGESQAVQNFGKALIALSREQGFALFLAMGTIFWGIALSEQEQGEEGIAQICQGLAGYRATGSGSAQTNFLFSLAAAYGRAGQEKAGLATLAEALAVVHTSGERWFEAELYRLKGELTLQSGVQSPESRVKEAEECFQQAIKIACQQSAKSWELRAAMSLSRLWQQQGKQAKARKMLAEIYGWFTEGFDTADLKEAKTLLAELV